MRSSSASIFGFPKEARFRRREDFQKLWTVGRKIHTPHFLVYWVRVDNPDTMGRLGVTVSRKVGNAVVRNRIKRLVRERFRLLRRQLGPVDFSIIAKRNAAAVDNWRLCQEIDQALFSPADKMAYP